MSKKRQMEMTEKLELSVPVFDKTDDKDEGWIVVRADNEIEFENLNRAPLGEIQDALDIADRFLKWKSNQLGQLKR